MFIYLLLLFTILPVVEIALLIRVGRAIEVGPTIALVVLTGIVGAVLAKHQGLRTLNRIQADLARGEMPTTELLNGVMILAAGLLLVTPGLITDAVGFALLFPPARNWMRRRLASYFKKRMTVVYHQPDPPEAVDRGFVDVDDYDVTDQGPPDGD